MIRDINIFFILTVTYHSVVGKVEGHFEYAADTGCHCDPEVDLRCFAVLDVLSLFCPDEPVQEVMPGIDLAH